MRFSTWRGAISTGRPSRNMASWMTWAVGSVAQGTSQRVEKSGRSSISPSEGS